MEVTVSSKYQIVIPKTVRRQLKIMPGQRLVVNKSDTSVTFTPPLSANEFLAKYAGSLKNTTWHKEGVDATAWLRRMRDTEWN